MAKAKALSILSALFVLTAGSVGGHAVQAEVTCLPAPTGKTPAGSHWHYHTDPVKQTKCWYLRSDAGQPAAATDGADAAGAAAKPAAAPKPTADGTGAEPHPRKPHQGARAGAGAKPAPAGAQPAPQAASPMQGAQTNSAPATQPPPQGATAWPDPQPQSATGNVAWPEPPSAAPATTMSAPPDTTTTNTAQEPPPAAGQDTGSINGNNANDAAPAEASPPPPLPAQSSDVSGSTILALAIAMAFVGILMRWLVGRLFARRRKLAAERREPVWVTDEYVMPDALTRGTRLPPDRVDPERLDDEVKHALRKLLRTLERSAA
jgi:hypothetical protein